MAIPEWPPRCKHCGEQFKEGDKFEPYVVVVPFGFTFKAVCPKCGKENKW